MDELDGLFRNSLNKEGKSLEGKEQGCDNMPGAFGISLNKDKMVRRSNEVQIHKKTVRTLCTKDAQLTTEIIDIIAIVDGYLELFNRHHEHEDRLLNWSVASKYYQSQQRKALHKAIERGYIERYKKNILTSPKGDKVLRDYDRTFEEEKQMYIRKAEAKETPVIRRRRNVRHAA